jgi:hypothetical protein
MSMKLPWQKPMKDEGRFDIKRESSLIMVKALALDIPVKG